MLKWTKRAPLDNLQAECQWSALWLTMVPSVSPSVYPQAQARGYAPVGARVGVERGVEGGSAQLAKLHTPTLISDPQSISGQETRM
jgi:hypothetical protein